ncbi:MAG: alcohol dehydrogenase catalytic domain-containing protein [Chloroflexi bacterium]|nr:alcohol dehydrogenase catalytic domain-containing protein [Chloroflexota bacterium]
MHGVYLPGDSTAVVRDVRVPAPRTGQVLLQMGASGICGSDIGYIYHGHKTHKGSAHGPAYAGVIAGHEPSGVVVEAGPACGHLRPGDRVIVYHIVGCGHCENCRSGFIISCSTIAARAGYGWKRDGGHAQYLLAEESSCLPLPDELSYLDGALIACGFGTAYEGLCRLQVSGADDLLVVGLGPVGLAAAMLGRALGAHRVLGAELNAARIEWARDLGLFDEIFDAGAAPLERILAETSGRGCSTAIDCSGSVPGRRLAVDAIAEWGRISLVGEGGTLETEVSDPLLHKQVTIYASWVTSSPRMMRLADQLARWDLHPERIVSDVFPLRDAEEAYKRAAGGSSGKVCLVPE